MTKSQIFTAAHQAARAATGVSYRLAFAAGLRTAYAALKAPVFVAPTIAGCIRGGSGSRAWVARITGCDERFGLAREFLRAGGSVSRSGRSGSFLWTLDRPGIYEIRDVQYDQSEATRGRLDSGFLHVAADGSVAHIDRDSVFAAR